MPASRHKLTISRSRDGGGPSLAHVLLLIPNCALATIVQNVHQLADLTGYYSMRRAMAAVQGSSQRTVHWR